MKELEQEKYNLIFNNSILLLNVIPIKNITYHEYTVAHTDDLKVIIKIIFINEPNEELIIYKNKKEFGSNKYTLINPYRWDYYLKICIHNTIYNIFDVFNNKEEKRFIISNFTKKQRKQISLMVFELFKWWIKTYSPDFISRILCYNKMLLNRYSILHDYLLDNEYVCRISKVYEDEVIYDYIKSKFRKYHIVSPELGSMSRNMMHKISFKFI